MPPAPNPTDDVCKNCRFWFVDAFPDPAVGQCHRNAPLANYMDGGLNYRPRPTWPITHETDFCGEFIKNTSIIPQDPDIGSTLPVDEETPAKSKRPHH